MDSTHKKNLSLEELLQRMTEITRTLENPDTGLERSIALYEEGLALAERCRQRLQEARQKLEKINPDSISSLPNPPKTGDLFDNNDNKQPNNDDNSNDTKK